MKRITLLIILLIILFQSKYIISQSGWTLVNPFPNRSEAITDIYFINDQTGFFISKEYYYSPHKTHLYKTTNGGINWNRSLIDSASRYEEAKFCFIDEQTGYITEGKTFITTNSGIQWSVTSNIFFYAISFINALTGYGNALGDEQHAFIYRTTNSGYNWVSLLPNITGYYPQLNDIYFENELTGFVVGTNKIIAKTTNGGTLWTYKVPKGNIFYYDIEFINQSTGFVCGGANNNDSTILKTTNNGENWIPVTVQNKLGAKSISFNGNNGLGVGNNILKSTDSGNNWLRIANPLDSFGYFNLNKVYFKNALTAYATGEKGSFIISSNSGSNWKSIHIGDTLKAVYFFNIDTGIVAGSKGMMLKTTNSGLNWISIPSNTNSTINDIFFWDVNTGIFICNDGSISRTPNSGLNWSSQFITNTKLCNFKSLKNTTAYIVGNNGKIFKTINQGVNWIEKNTGVTTNLNSIFLVSPEVYVAVGDSGVVIRSNNAGESWMKNIVLPKQNLYSLSFYDSSNGYLVGDSGFIYKSSNAGNNWLFFNKFIIYRLNNIIFKDSGVGYIFHNGAHCMKTTNYGLTWGWQGVQYSYDRHIYNSYFLNSRTGFIVGLDGEIYKTIDGGGNMNLLGIDQTSTKIPKYYELYQNYPNPFNPSTKIKFSLPLSSKGWVIKISIKVYDIIGKEVADLTPFLGKDREGLQPGTYEVEWNGTGYASGIYFYSLQVGDIIITKKMVLLK